MKTTSQAKMSRGVATVTVRGAARIAAWDHVAIEEPLEIQVSGIEGESRTVSITMRTPGHDVELAVGFLWSEGVIVSSGQILGSYGEGNVVRIVTSEDALQNLDRLSRNFYTTSSCGVCGKTSMDTVRRQTQFAIAPAAPRVDSQALIGMPDIVRRAQTTFDQTGGLHAAALLDVQGALIALREDVGRHNAVDKLIGAQALEDRLPLSNSLLFLSGRASFELIQKARVAGIPIVAAVGAPSSLAVEMAVDAGITLIGFLRGERFNLYSCAERVQISPPREAKE